MAIITFSPSTQIRSSDVNANFTELADDIDDINTTLSALPSTYVQIGAGNAAATPVELIVVSSLPAAGVKGRVAVLVPFSLP